MKNFVVYSIRKIDWLSLWSGRILSLFVLVMIGIILFEVIARYFFDSPTLWASEAATMVFGVYMMGGGIYALLINGHVRMDALYNKWSPKAKAYSDILTFPLFLIFIGILMWKSTAYGIESFMMKEHSSTAWGPAIYHWKMMVPIIVFLILLQGLSDFMKNVIFVLTGEEV